MTKMENRRSLAERSWMGWFTCSTIWEFTPERSLTSAFSVAHLSLSTATWTNTIWFTPASRLCHALIVQSSSTRNITWTSTWNQYKKSITNKCKKSKTEITIIENLHNSCKKTYIPLSNLILLVYSIQFKIRPSRKNTEKLKWLSLGYIKDRAFGHKLTNKLNV